MASNKRKSLSPTQSKIFLENSKVRISEIKNRRIVTPNTVQYCEHLLQTCDQALQLDAKDDDTYNALITVIQRDISHLQKRFDANLKYENEIRDLQAIRDSSYQLLYGDYMAPVCGTLRNEADRVRVGDFQGLQWWEVSARIKSEEKKLSAWEALTEDERKKKDQPEMHMKRALEQVAEACGYKDIYLAIFSIDEYAQRCQSAHCGIEVLVKEREWATLADKIVLDRAELEKWVPIEKLDIYKNGIDKFQCKYFNYIDEKWDTELQRNRVTNWRLTDALDAKEQTIHKAANAQKALQTPKSDEELSEEEL